MLHSIYPPWICCLLLSIGLALGLAFALVGCGKRAVAELEPREVYIRGDRVVVEQAAAQFFEGRVLTARPGELRVQASGGNDAVKVAPSDVYRIPPAAHDFSPDMLAICGHAELWQPCRLVSIAGSKVTASDATGAELSISRDEVLVPSALTELNLRQFFKRSEAELAFARSAARAGDPRPEPSWHPGLHERLLVKVGADWLTGYVRELGDETAQVTLAAGRTLTVSRAALAAEPPSSFATELKRGDFVLVRPETPADPWIRCQVRAVNETELRLADARAALKTLTRREVLPLRP